jgi:hypothetical protein
VIDTQKALAETTVYVVRFMHTLAEYIKPYFPHNANVLADLIVGRKMTNERWIDVSRALASLAAIPGVYLQEDEHDVRNPALRAVNVAKKMASATYGVRVDVEYELWCATWMSDEIVEWIDEIKKRKAKDE